jgi:hypothetical protein
MADQQIDPPIDPTMDPALNPSLQQSVNGLTSMQGMTTMSPEAMQSIQKFVQQPALKKFVALATNPEFTTDLTNIIQHPQLKQCGQWELGWIVVMVIFRSWWMSKADHWLKSLWTSLWTFIVFWVVAAIGIPSYFLNPDYMKLIKMAYRFLS